MIRSCRGLKAMFLEAADHLDVHAGLGADAVDDLAAVGGTAGWRRSPWPGSPLRRRLRRAAGSGARSPPPGRRRSGDRAVAAHDVAEAQHLLLLHERIDVAVGVPRKAKINNSPQPLARNTSPPHNQTLTPAHQPRRERVTNHSRPPPPHTSPHNPPQPQPRPTACTRMCHRSLFWRFTDSRPTGLAGALNEVDLLGNRRTSRS